METNGVYMLFAKGKRPDRAAVAAFLEERSIASFSDAPSGGEDQRLVVADKEAAPGTDAGASRRKVVCAELVSQGLTFDLTGLSPGDARAFPVAAHRVDCEALPSDIEYEALHLAPGHHLAGGERSLPVAKGLLGLACAMAQDFDDLAVVVWPPSRSAIGRQFFQSAIAGWLEGGAFPARGLVAFATTADGTLQSEGLAFWIGQELRIEPPLSSDITAASRLGAELVGRLLLVGGVDGSERIVAPDGSRLVLRTSRNGTFIRVSQD